MKPLKLILPLTILIPGLFGCAAKYDFNKIEDGVAKNGQSTTSTTPPVVVVTPPTPPVVPPFHSINVCDPTMELTTTAPTNGLIGKFYYLDNSQPHYSNSADYILSGHAGADDIYAPQANFPTHEYSTGLAIEPNNVLTDANNAPLTEWFAVDLKSNLKLGANEGPGTYQLAMIADDGSTLYAQFIGDPDRETLISAEGLTSSRLGCATEAVQMDKNTRLPIEVTYFQGPQTKIALVMLWRKVTLDPSLPNNGLGADLGDAQCGQSGDNQFYTQATPQDTPVPTANLVAMFLRGWKVLGTDNFEISTGVKSCGPQQ